MKNLSRRKKNNIIIASLCGVLLLMGIGYAAFSTQLKINGTSSISSEWNIRITNIETALPSEMGAPIPDGYNISEPTYTAESATFSAGFELPGSVIGYIVEVSNLGSIDGQVGIGNLSCGDNSAIMCQAMATDEEGINGFEFQNGSQDYSNINFPLKVGEKHYIMVMVGYDDVTEQPTDLDANIKLDLTYEQYVDPNRPIPSGETTLIGGQEVDIVSGGDGLYADEYESGRYIYRGTNPDNYIAFGEETTVNGYIVTMNGEDVGVPSTFTNQEDCQAFLEETFADSSIPEGIECTYNERTDYTGGLWRIISKETDHTYKIIRNELLPNTNNNYDMQYDEGGNRSKINNTYCDFNYSWAGCGVFAAVDGIFQTPDGKHSGTVTENSSIQKYLNGEYYNNLSSSVKNLVISHSFNIGPVEYANKSGNDSIKKNVAGEKMYQWIGYVGLINVSDLLKASTKNDCISATDAEISLNKKTSACSSYLISRELIPPAGDEYCEWTINAAAQEEEHDSNDVWVSGCRAYKGCLPYISIGSSGTGLCRARPVVYLNSSITLQGTGSEDDPFVIVN